jgi:uncharacterized protein (DUF433 family)
MDQGNVIGAFSEEQVARLTGLSRAQLRRWNLNGFIRPAFRAGDDAGKPFTYIYSFKDLLKLRVLNQLRNVHGVSMPELRKVEHELAQFGEDKWTSQKLWVHNRRVVFREPQSEQKREVSSKQFVAEIALAVVTSDARQDIAKLNRRDSGQIGKVERKRHLHASEPVFAGTRITVKSIGPYLRGGYSDDAILRQFPGLEPGDIAAARTLNNAEAA